MMPMRTTTTMAIPIRMRNKMAATLVMVVRSQMILIKMQVLRIFRILMTWMMTMTVFWMLKTHFNWETPLLVAVMHLPYPLLMSYFQIPA